MTDEKPTPGTDWGPTAGLRRRVAELEAEVERLKRGRGHYRERWFDLMVTRFREMGMAPGRAVSEAEAIVADFERAPGWAAGGPAVAAGDGGAVERLEAENARLGADLRAVVARCVVRHEGVWQSEVFGFWLCLLDHSYHEDRGAAERHALRCSGLKPPAAVAGGGGACEHGVGDGGYCEACNREYKAARAENGIDDGEPGP